MKTRGKYYFFLLVLFMSVFLGNPLGMTKASADSAFSQSVLPLQNIKVDPIISELELTPGQTTNFLLEITNLSAKPLGIRADIADFTQPQDGPDQNTPAEDTKKSPLISWTIVSDQNIILGPLDKNRILVSITPPKNAPSSGYSEVIYLTPFVSNPHQIGSPIVLSRIGSVVLATIGKLNYTDLARKVSLTSFAASSLFVDHSPVTLHFRVENNYFTFFTAKPFLTITPLVGKPQEILLEEKHIFPGSSRTWTASLAVPTNWLFYRAHLAVSIGNGKQVYADTFFVLFPYIMTVGLLACILLLLILLLRKRIYKTILLLIKGEKNI